MAISVLNNTTTTGMTDLGKQKLKSRHTKYYYQGQWLTGLLFYYFRWYNRNANVFQSTIFTKWMRTSQLGWRALSFKHMTSKYQLASVDMYVTLPSWCGLQYGRLLLADIHISCQIEYYWFVACKHDMESVSSLLGVVRSSPLGFTRTLTNFRLSTSARHLQIYM